jgi:streptogramin lyase
MTNSIKETIGLDSRPRLIASGEGSIWALHLRDGSISRIDGLTGKVTAKISAGAVDSDGDITVGDGFVWVTTRILPVIKVDPQDNSRVGAYKAPPGTIMGRRVRYGGGSLWVSGGSIFKVAVPH